MKYKRNLGFTLIELLIVIAIIGILASAILVGLNGAKSTAKDAAVLSSATSTVGAVLLCMDRNIDINAPNPNGDNAICTSTTLTDKWPDMSDNDFKWDTGGYGKHSTGQFSYSASDSTGRKITCSNLTNGRCTKSW